MALQSSKHAWTFVCVPWGKYGVGSTGGRIDEVVVV